MAAPALTAATIRYLFASTWAPRDDSGLAMHVPGASVNGPDLAGNLLNLAIWNLCEHGRVEVQQLRPVEVEKVASMGGHSFARLTVLDWDTKLPGLEGALLRAARANHGQRGLRRIDDAIAKLLSGDDENGVRGLVLALGINGPSPWNAVANHCCAEALAAGLIEIKGRLFPKPVIVDSAAVEALRSVDAEIVALRTSYRQREPEIDAAVIGDCLHAVHWAHHTPD